MILLKEVLSNTPIRSKSPDILRARAFMYWLRKRLNQKNIKGWEVDQGGVVRVYFSAIHHDPNTTPSNQLIPKLLMASQKFNAPFRMFGDGNNICLEIRIT